MTREEALAQYAVDRNLAGRDLHGLDLRGVNLTGAALNHADLTDTDLSGAILNNANLRRAYLVRTNLTNAKLVRASLCGATVDVAAPMILRGADLSNTDLTGATLRNVDLTDVKWNRYTVWPGGIIPHGLAPATPVADAPKAPAERPDASRYAETARVGETSSLPMRLRYAATGSGGYGPSDLAALLEEAAVAIATTNAEQDTASEAEPFRSINMSSHDLEDAIETWAGERYGHFDGYWKASVETPDGHKFVVGWVVEDVHENEDDDLPLEEE